MKSVYELKFGFLDGALSAFDLGGILQENAKPLARGLDFDMQQLSNDHSNILTDYRNATRQVEQKMSGDCFE